MPDMEINRDKLSAGEFVDTFRRMGCGTRKDARKYVADNPKERYGIDDVIALYRAVVSAEGVEARQRDYHTDEVPLAGGGVVPAGGYTKKCYIETEDGE